MTFALAPWVVAAGLFLFTLCYHHPRFGWTLFLILMLLPMLRLGVDGRPMAAFVALAQFAAVGGSFRRGLRGPSLKVWRAYAALVLLFAVTVVFSVDRARTVEALSAWMVLLAAVPVFMVRLAGQTMVRITAGVMSVVVMASALIVALGLPSAFAGARAVGLMTNANGLGVLCGLIVPIVLAQRNWKVALLVVPVAGYLILMSQSRAGMLTAGLGLVAFHWMRAGRIGRSLTLPLALGTGIWIAQWDFWSVSRQYGLARTNNSRSTEWNFLINEFRQRPWFGSGYGTQDGLGSSFLKLAAELGIVGIIAGLIFLIYLLWCSRLSILAAPVLFAALANGVFEGWLLAAGSAYAVILFVVLVAGLDSRTEAPLDARIFPGRVPNAEVRG